MGKPLVDNGFEFRGATGGSAADHSTGDQGKEALDLLENGAALANDASASIAAKRANLRNCILISWAGHTSVAAETELKRAY